jgi:glycogen operon protein
MNAYWQPLEFELPPTRDAGPWRRWIDTFLAPPDDIVDWSTALPISGESYHAGPRSVVVVYR